MNQPVTGACPRGCGRRRSPRGNERTVTEEADPTRRSHLLESSPHGSLHRRQPTNCVACVRAQPAEPQARLRAAEQRAQAAEVAVLEAKPGDVEEGKGGDFGRFGHSEGPGVRLGQGGFIGPNERDALGFVVEKCFLLKNASN